MFYDYIYLDMDRILAYAAKLGMKKPNFSKMMERTTNSSENVYTEGISLDTQELIREYRDVDSDETYFEDFERKLESVKSEGFYSDMTIDAIDIKSLKKQSIIKFEAMLLIPEEFGQVDFINAILHNPYGKKAVFDSIDEEKIPKEFFNGLIREDKDIPLYFDVGDYKFYSSLKGRKLRNISYSDFEEYVGEEVTIVAKIEKIDNKDNEILLFDIYKDLLNINRAMRRSITEGNSNDIPEKITISGKSVRLAIIAMYK